MNDIQTQEAPDASSNSLMIIDQAKQLQVVDVATRTSAAALIITAKIYIKEREKYHEAFKSKAHSAWKEACQREKDEIDPVKEMVIKPLEAQVRDFDLAEKRRRDEEEARLREEAEKKRAALNQQIQKAYDKNDLDKVDALTEKQAQIMDPVLPKEPGMVKFGSGASLSGTDDIEVEVTDILALIQAIAALQAPTTIVEIKKSTLKQWIKTSGIKHVPGVVIRETKRYTTRIGGK